MLQKFTTLKSPLLSRGEYSKKSKVPHASPKLSNPAVTTKILFWWVQHLVTPLVTCLLITTILKQLVAAIDVNGGHKQLHFYIYLILLLMHVYYVALGHHNISIHLLLTNASQVLLFHNNDLHTHNTMTSLPGLLLACSCHCCLPPHPKHDDEPTWLVVGLLLPPLPWSTPTTTMTLSTWQ
jgi:hypothetical protein